MEIAFTMPDTTTVTGTKETKISTSLSFITKFKIKFFLLLNYDTLYLVKYIDVIS